MVLGSPAVERLVWWSARRIQLPSTKFPLDIAKVAIVLGGLSFLPRGVHNWTDTQTSAGNHGSVPAIELQINLDGVAEIAKPQVDAPKVNTKPEGDNPCSLETFPANELSLNRSSGYCALP